MRRYADRTHPIDSLGPLVQDMDIKHASAQVLFRKPEEI